MERAAKVGPNTRSLNQDSVVDVYPVGYQHISLYAQYDSQYNVTG